MDPDRSQLIPIPVHFFLRLLLFSSPGGNIAPSHHFLYSFRVLDFEVPVPCLSREASFLSFAGARLRSSVENHPF